MYIYVVAAWYNNNTELIISNSIVLKITLTFLLYLVFAQCQLSFSQVKDSVCAHDFYGTSFRAIGIRKIDSAGYASYKVNSAYFGKGWGRDSLYIYVKSHIDCLPATAFVGEYTGAGSIRFVDFLRSRGIKPTVQVENICGYTIYRNQLADLKRLVANIDTLSIKIVSATMYIQLDTGYVNFNLEDGIFSDEVKKCLVKMHEGQVIVFDNIRVLIRQDGLRTIQNPPGYIIKD